MATATSFPFITNKVRLTPRAADSESSEFDFTATSIEVDATITEQHKVTINVARHPVSRGLAVVDNVRPEPDGLTLTCLFSQTPTRIDEALARTVRGYEPESVLADIKEKAKLGYVWTVETSLEKYENMVIESLDTPRDVNLANVVQVTIVFSERRLAVEEYTTAETKKPTNATAKKATQKGKQAPKTLKPNTAGVQVIDGIKNAVRVFTGGQ